MLLSELNNPLVACIHALEDPQVQFASAASIDRLYQGFSNFLIFMQGRIRFQVSQFVENIAFA